MAFPSRIYAGLLLFIFINITAAVEKDNADRCECFRTNGSTHFFANHIFRDFRDIGGDSGDVPSIITDADDSAAAFATSKYFLSDEWTDLWATQSWNNSQTMEDNSASVLMVNSPNNVYIEESKDNDPTHKTFLTLRTSRLPTFQSAAEIDTRAANYQYLSMRFLARVTGSPGACAGIFTYLAGPNNDPEKVQEADIEILTSGPRNVVQYTNQPSDSDSGHPISQATRNSTNPGDRDWTLWNTYRYDWTPETSSWYVNGESVANISFQVPRDPTQVILNMWSDGGVWTGNMSTFEQAYLQIQWLQMVYNTSGPATSVEGKKRDMLGDRGMLPVEALGRREDAGCALVCSVDDDVEVLGTPAFLYNDTGSGVGWVRGEGLGMMAWMPMVLVVGAIWMGL